MTRLAFIAAAALFAVPAVAGTYTATPASPGIATKVVARDIAWTYAGGTYTGRTAESRTQDTRIQRSRITEHTTT